MLNTLKAFMRLESASSLVLLAMTLLAMLAANSPFASLYSEIQAPVPMLVINEGLMALFFLCIGIEVRQETRGSLSQLRLPLAAACGGVVVPALIFLFLNRDGAALRGWAVPTATDIAFSLGMLSLFGSRVPPALRMFLLSVAVFDDLIAVLVIALFYTQGIEWLGLLFALGCLLLLGLYNRHVRKLAPFLFAGAALWLALFDAGVNPALAGVALGLLLPADLGKRVLRFLHVPVDFIVVPVFVLANAGLPLEGLGLSALEHPVSAGIAGGLFFGKQGGIFLTSCIAIRLGWAKLPDGCGWKQLYAVSLLGGIGFTMSLFIGTLAFGDTTFMSYAKLGVLTGSLASAAAGIICMALSLQRGSKRP